MSRRVPSYDLLAAKSSSDFADGPLLFHAKYLVTKDLAGASMANCQMRAQKEAPPKLDLARYNSRYRRVGFAGSEIFGFGHP
jgi:hypothetical protein